MYCKVNIDSTIFITNVATILKDESCAEKTEKCVLSINFQLLLKH